MSNKNSINILLLKNKIIKLNNWNQKGQFFIWKLLSRYFADFIIKLLIKEYPFKFRTIIVTLNNFQGIISMYGIEIINKNNLESIKNLIKILLSKETNEVKKKCFVIYFNKTKDNTKVIFIEEIQINNRIIKKEELNFVLGSLFYLKY